LARSLLSRKLVLTAACVLLVGAGCGESEGVAEGATASVYAAAPLCAEAKRELARDGGQAGDVRVRVRVICLSSAESSQELNLVAIGANARRATEDSTTIGYIGEPTRAASRFSEPILESAGIAQLSQTSGAAAMAKLLEALKQSSSGNGSLRQSVYDQLE
jgi:branched-chain amino acid transport system substrate-binding protein